LWRWTWKPPTPWPKPRKVAGMANNLQIGLAVMGGLVLAAVVAHSTWKTRRDAPRQASDSPKPSAASERERDFERIEPGLDLAGADGALPAQSQDAVQADSLLGSMTSAPFTATLQDKHPALDALVDAIAPIELDNPVSGEAALAALPPSRRAGSKPLAVEGLNAHTHTWQALQAGQRYTQFQAGVQLANRMGAMNEIEFSEFVQKAQSFADDVGGNAQFPDMLEQVARARELDQFASAHDAQLRFILRAKSAAWSPGYVQQNAARLGFVAGTIPGRMVLPSSEAGAPPVLSLAFDTQAALAENPEQSALRSLSLALDVPQVPREEQAFARMRQCAQQLATTMDGTLTDDQGQAIAAQALDVIAADLEQLYNALQERDLAAGSGLARRLFS
jgi:ZipA, C-terminal FtsZ-binding domain